MVSNYCIISKYLAYQRYW